MILSSFLLKLVNLLVITFFKRLFQVFVAYISHVYIIMDIDMMLFLCGLTESKYKVKLESPLTFNGMLSKCGSETGIYIRCFAYEEVKRPDTFI